MTPAIVAHDFTINIYANLEPSDTKNRFQAQPDRPLKTYDINCGRINKARNPPIIRNSPFKSRKTSRAWSKSSPCCPWGKQLLVIAPVCSAHNPTNKVPVKANENPYQMNATCRGYLDETHHTAITTITNIPIRGIIRRVIPNLSNARKRPGRVRPESGVNQCFRRYAVARSRPTSNRDLAPLWRNPKEAPSSLLGLAPFRPR